MDNTYIRARMTEMEYFADLLRWTEEVVAQLAYWVLFKEMCKAQGIPVLEIAFTEALESL